MGIVGHENLILVGGRRHIGRGASPKHLPPQIFSDNYALRKSVAMKLCDFGGGLFCPIPDKKRSCQVARPLYGTDAVFI